MLRSQRISSLSLLMLAPAFAGGPVARAADVTQNESGAGALQEVVVTAQKREEKLHDVPMGVSAVAGDEMKKLQLVSLADLEAKVPGLSVQLSAPGLARLTIRAKRRRRQVYRDHLR
jgi:iron complex outermembrane receptor protein